MSDQFPREARLLQRAQFDQVFSAPEQKSSDRYFTVLGRCSIEQSSRLRLGLVVAKKRIAKAHERNRVKRLIRESFRQLPINEKAIDIKAIDIIVMPKSSVVAVENKVLFDALQKHWQRMLR